MKKQLSQGRIFLSYRREDTSGYAGRLFDHIKNHFGKDRVFMDISNIEPGVDFVDSIEKALSSCDAFLVLIGSNWLDCRDASGERRIDNPDDFIRIETSTALKRGVRVFPILVKGAKMPSLKDLPEDMAALARRNAHELSDQRWEYDCNKLIMILESIIGTPEDKLLVQPVQPRPNATGEQDEKKMNTKVFVSLGLSALVLLTLLTEGIEDSDTFVGGVILAVVALIIGLIGLFDVKMNKASGGGMAIGSIICAVLVGLMVVGDYPGDVPYVPNTEVPNQFNIGTHNLPQPVIPFDPQTAANINGSWQGSDGFTYMIEQSGNQVNVYGLNAYGVPIMTGQGTFSGSKTIHFNFSLADGTVGESTLEVADHGRVINGAFNNHTTGLFSQIILSR